MNRAWALLVLAALIILLAAGLLKSAPRPSPAPTSSPSHPALSTPPSRLPSGSVAVTTGDGSAPLGDVRLVLSPEKGRSDLEGRSGPDGRCRFPAVPAGRWTLSASHPRFAPSTGPLEVAGDRETAVAITLISGGRLTGGVRDDATNQPVAGATLTLLDPLTRHPRSASLRTRTNERGEFALDQVPLGPAGLLVTAPNYRPFDRYDLAIARDGETLTVDVRMKAGTTVAGRVVDAAGAPVAGATVSGSNEHTGDARTDADGRFSIGGLGDGPVHLFAQAEGFGPTFVRNVAPFTTTLEIRLGRAATVAGRVVAQPPPRRFSLLFYRYDPDFRKTLLVKTQQVDSADGSFSVGGIAEGRYQLKLEAADYSVASDLEIVVRAGETVAGLEFSAAPKSP